MLPQAYLTDKQLAVWSLLLKDLSKAEIGRRLGVTRQAIHEAGDHHTQRQEGG